MTDDTNKTNRQLSTTDSTPDLRGVIGGDRDPEDVDVFGFEIIYTTGEFLIPRDELLAKLAEIGIPEWMAPGEVQPHRAFGRMREDLFDESEGFDEIEYQDQTVRFEMESAEKQTKSGKRKDHYTQHVHARVWHPPELTNENEGKWIDHDLGVIKYDKSTQGISFIDRISEDRALHPIWEQGIKKRASGLFEKHQQSNNGGDINNMVYYLARNWTDSVKLRDACYFVPAAYSYVDSDGTEHSIATLIDAFRELYDWINREYKTAGQTTELYAIEIIDSERQRQMVESKVNEELEDRVTDVFEDVIDQLQGDAVADEVAEEVVESLDGISGVAQRHSAALKTELGVKRVMGRVLDDMAEEKREVVREVLDEAGVEPEAVPA